MKYAQNTTVTKDRSIAEIERTLTRYGATGFVYGWEGNHAAIAFQMKGRRVRFMLPLPDPNNREYRLTTTGRERTTSAAKEAYEQDVRQRWRALALVIKAKLEAVEAGITTFEEEFLAHIVLPGGPTIAQWLLPQVEQAYQTGKMPPLLPMPEEQAL